MNSSNQYFASDRIQGVQVPTRVGVGPILIKTFLKLHICSRVACVLTESRCSLELFINFSPVKTRSKVQLCEVSAAVDANV